MILQKIQDDTVSALKAGQKEIVDTLRFATAELKNKAIEKRTELTDEEIAGALSGMIKKLTDSIEQFEKAGRNELASQYKAQVATLKSYLPEEINDAELESIVQGVIDANEALASNMGALIGKSIAEVKGKASSSRVAEVVKRLTQAS